MQNQMLLSVDEAAKALSMGKTKLYSELKAGKLPGLKLGKKTLIKRADLEDYIESLSAYPSQASQA